jgi:hypothetical protein
LVCGLLICGLLILWLRGLLITTLIAALLRCALLAATEKLHVVGNNLGSIALLAILLPLAAA